MTDSAMCCVPVVGCITKNATTGKWEINEEKSVWADVPADQIACKLVEGFEQAAILNSGGDTE